MHNVILAWNDGTLAIRSATGYVLLPLHLSIGSVLQKKYSQRDFSAVYNTPFGTHDCLSLKSKRRNDPHAEDSHRHCFQDYFDQKQVFISLNES